MTEGNVSSRMRCMESWNFQYKFYSKAPIKNTLENMGRFVYKRYMFAGNNYEIN